ncbi:MAG: DUF2933 domain-containing protein [Sporichthyaceae bacterium]
MPAKPPKPMMNPPTIHAPPELEMNHEQMVKPAVIAGAVLVALVIAGLPAGYLGFLVLILACPLMMFFMMRGMDHGGGGTSHDHDQHATHGRRDDH